MPRQFTAEHFCFLLEAYDRLGAHLYGDEWTGQELLAWDYEAPEQIASTLEPINARIEELDRLIEQTLAAKARTPKSSEIDKYNKEIDAAYSERSDLLEERASMPDPSSEGYRRDYAKVVRRAKTKNRLLEALRRGDLSAQFGVNLLIEWKRWETEKGFKLFWEISTLAVPGRLAARRRAPVLIPRDEFGRWLSAQVPENLPPESLHARKAKLAEYLRAECADGPKTMTRKAFEEVAERDFNVTAKMARNIWKDIAPDNWKQPGRPKGS